MGKGREISTGTAIAIIIIVLIVVLVGGWYLFLRPPKLPPPPPTNVARPGPAMPRPPGP